MCIKLLDEMIRKWAAVISHPMKFFKKENKASSLSYGAKSVILSGVISAIITIVIGLVYPQVLPEFAVLLGTNLTAAVIILILIGMPLMAIVGWLIVSAVFFVFAKSLGGKGTYTSQSHGIALINSVFNIITTVVFALLAIVAAGLISVQIAINVIIAVYNFYVITIALRSIHKYSTVRAVFTWLIPVIIILILVLVAGLLVLSALNIQ